MILIRKTIYFWFWIIHVQNYACKKKENSSAHCDVSKLAGKRIRAKQSRPKMICMLVHINQETANVIWVLTFTVTHVFIFSVLLTSLIITTSGTLQTLNQSTPWAYTPQYSRWCIPFHFPSILLSTLTVTSPCVTSCICCSLEKCWTLYEIIRFT